jgi:hypothetical protein
VILIDVNGVIPRIVFVLAFCATALRAGAEVEVVRVFTGWRDASSFKRISEYFTGRENTGNQVVLRSTPEERGGYYFLIRLRNTGAPIDGKFVFQVIGSTSTRPREFAFATRIPSGSTVFNLGLTGPHWAGKETNAIAWKLEIVDASGRIVATDQSYLWEKPDQ